jgi:hypothetical protein
VRLLHIEPADNPLTRRRISGPNLAFCLGDNFKLEAVMGLENEIADTKARPILNERDYQNAKALLAKEMRNTHSDKVWARLEALMQAVSDYERRFLEGDEDDATDWIEYAYATALEEAEVPHRRWSDSTEDYLIES